MGAAKHAYPGYVPSCPPPAGLVHVVTYGRIPWPSGGTSLEHVMWRVAAMAVDCARATELHNWCPNCGQGCVPNWVPALFGAYALPTPQQTGARELLAYNQAGMLYLKGLTDLERERLLTLVEVSPVDAHQTLCAAVRVYQLDCQHAEALKAWRADG